MLPPNITLPPPDPAYFIDILLFIDDFTLLVSSRAQFLDLVQLTQTWRENNSLLLAYEKCKVIIFHESTILHCQLASLPWTTTSSFPSPSVQIVEEVDTFHYLGTTLYIRVTLDQFKSLHTHPEAYLASTP
jgi:hypothetical protein